MESDQVFFINASQKKLWSNSSKNESNYSADFGPNIQNKLSFQDLDLAISDQISNVEHKSI